MREPGQVRLRVAAAGLNRLDVFVREGLEGPGIRPAKLGSALTAADPETRRSVFDAFRLSIALDRNSHQIRVKALISSAFTKAHDLQQLVANETIAGAGYGPIGDLCVPVEQTVFMDAAHPSVSSVRRYEPSSTRRAARIGGGASASRPGRADES